MTSIEITLVVNLGLLYLLEFKLASYEQEKGRAVMNMCVRALSCLCGGGGRGGGHYCLPDRTGGTT